MIIDVLNTERIEHNYQYKQSKRAKDVSLMGVREHLQTACPFLAKACFQV